MMEAKEEKTPKKIFQEAKQVLGAQIGASCLPKIFLH
jgi:hypothetical protein